MRRDHSVRVRALLSLGIVAGVGAVGTLAAWSDSATATAQFSAGTVDLRLNGKTDGALALTSLDMANMSPGSSRAAALTVANAGSLPFTYNFTTTATNTTTLGGALTVTVHPGGPAADGTNCTNTTVLMSGALNGATLSASRPLAATVSEQLCIRVSLPTNAANTLQGTNSTATFTFTATQAG